MYKAPKNPTAQLKPIFDETFDYEIGQVVTSKAYQALVGAEVTINAGAKSGYTDRLLGAPAALVVLQRHIHECHGGIQIQYLVSGASKDNMRGTSMVFEHELVPYDDVVAVSRSLQQAYNGKKGE